jgi:hypothetical protein
MRKEPNDKAQIDPGSLGGDGVMPEGQANGATKPGVDEVKVEVCADRSLRLDSRPASKLLGIAHRSAYRLILKHRAGFEKVGGQLRFQIAVAPGKGGNPAKYAMLTEDHCYYLVALVRPTEEADVIKQNLIIAFREARRMANVVPEVLTDWEKGRRLDAQYAVAKDKAHVGGQALRQWRTLKPQYDAAYKQLNVKLQLELPWDKPA